MSANPTCPEEIPSWQDIEDIGAGDGVPTECERCGKPDISPISSVAAENQSIPIYWKTAVFQYFLY